MKKTNNVTQRTTTPERLETIRLIKSLTPEELQKVIIAIDILQEDETIASVQELMAKVTERLAQAN